MMPFISGPTPLWLTIRHVHRSHENNQRTTNEVKNVFTGILDTILTRIFERIEKFGDHFSKSVHQVPALENVVQQSTIIVSVLPILYMLFGKNIPSGVYVK